MKFNDFLDEVQLKRLEEIVALYSTSSSIKRDFKMPKKGTKMTTSKTTPPISVNAQGFKRGEVWSAISTMIQNVHRLLLYGSSGTGKTHQATLSNLRPQEKVFQITLTPDTPAASLLGHFILKGNDCLWMDGVGMAAWKASHNGPTRLVINEIDHAGPDAISAMHVLLDDIRTAGITLPTGEHAKPHENLRIIATMNGMPEDLLPSLQDRFAIRILVDEVHPDAVAALPEKLRTLATNSCLIKDPMRKISVRAWMAFAEVSEKTKDINLAAKVVFGERWKELVDAIKIS